jgi:predicted acyl esterase
VRFSSAAAQTVLSGGDPSIGPQLDPIVGTAAATLPGADPECQPFTAVNWPGTAVYTHPVTHTFTMLGLPTMRMHIGTVGDHGQLNARLWDVAPDGKETFVSRGTYALTDHQTGTITWQMWGGGHTFPKGDTIRVELLAQDVPIERPSPSPFAVTVSAFTIELPSHEAPNGGEIVAPALAAG